MPNEKQIEAAADQISEGLGAFLRKFCDSEASKRARYYLHEMPKDEWNQMALMLATEALTAAEQAEPAPAAEAVAWVAADTLNSPHPGCVSSLAYMSQIDKDTGREYVPLYPRPTTSEARLREAAREAVNFITHHAEDNENTRWVLSLLNTALAQGAER